MESNRGPRPSVLSEASLSLTCECTVRERTPLRARTHAIEIGACRGHAYACILFSSPCAKHPSLYAGVSQRFFCERFGPIGIVIANSEKQANGKSTSLQNFKPLNLLVEQEGSLSMRKTNKKTSWAGPVAATNLNGSPSKPNVVEPATDGQAVSEEAIRKSAYRKWEDAGKPCGDGLRFWLEAEQELVHAQEAGIAGIGN